MTDAAERSVDTVRERFEALYAAFNRRDAYAVLAEMAPDVDWPNAMEGTRVHGHAAVRDYWTRQWSEIRPRVTPVAITEDADGRVVVRVHLVVRDMVGTLLADEHVEHVYTMRGDLVEKMEVRDA